jgi:hypothetical protein
MTPVNDASLTKRPRHAMVGRIGGATLDESWSSTGLFVEKFVADAARQLLRG